MRVTLQRQAEFEVLSSLLSDVLHGKGGAALITGLGGYGRTSLLRTFGEEATARGAVFLGASATRADDDPAELFGQLLLHPRIPASAAEYLSEIWVEGGRPPSAAQLHRFWRPVQELADRTPVVIGIDDTHHAGAEVLRSLLYLTRRLDTAPILIAMTLSSCPLDERPQFSAEMSSQPHCSHIRLEPLPPPAAADAVRRALRPITQDVKPSGFVRLSAGNPLLLSALVADARAYRPPAGTAVPGGHFATAVWRLLHRGHPTVAELARAVAVLGDVATPGLLAEILTIDPTVAVQGLQSLEASGLLLGGGFRADAARDAVLSKIPAKRQTELLLRAAAVLRDDGAPPTRLAALLSKAGDIDEPWMVDVLRDAAGQEERGNFPRAVRYLRLARQASARGGPEHAQITSDLAAAEWQIDPLSVVRLLPDLDEAARGGRLTSSQTENLVTCLLWHGQRENALALLASGVDLGAPPDWAEGFRSWLYPSLVPERAGPPDDVRTAGTAAIPGMEIDDDMLIAAEQSLLNTRLDDSALVPALSALSMLVYTDRLDRAGTWIDILLQAAERRGSVTWRALLSTALSIIDLRRGDLTAADAHAQRALSLLSNRSWGMAISLPLSSAVNASTDRGRHDEAAALLAVPLPDGMFETLPGLYYMYARARHHAAIGHHLTALADYDSCGELMRSWEIDQPALIPWRNGAALAGLRLGRTTYARALLAEQLALTEPWDLRTRGATLRIHAMLSHGADRVAMLCQAVAAAEQTSDLVGLATVLIDLGRAQRAQNDLVGAEATWRRAGALIARTGMKTPSDAPSQARSTDDDRAGTMELSDAEQRVASLAAAGYSNREIATELCITVSTIEQHLTRVYRKLKVSRRPHLAKALDGLT